jgi:hypothetical protein
MSGSCSLHARPIHPRSEAMFNSTFLEIGPDWAVLFRLPQIRHVALSSNTFYNIERRILFIYLKLDLINPAIGPT